MGKTASGFKIVPHYQSTLWHNWVFLIPSIFLLAFWASAGHCGGGGRLMLHPCYTILGRSLGFTATVWWNCKGRTGKALAAWRAAVSKGRGNSVLGRHLGEVHKEEGLKTEWSLFGLGYGRGWTQELEWESKAQVYLRLLQKPWVKAALPNCPV